VVLLSSGRLSTRRNLFQAILYELGRAYRGMDEGELRLALVDHLTGSEECAQGMLLLVDEAHSLPLRLFEEIRMLTNLAQRGQPQVRLLIAGSCVLEERLAHPKLDSFSQRLVARCYLESLNRTETEDYIHAQLHSAAPTGYPAAETIFPTDVCRSVFRATDGVPRLINQVCDHALLLAYAGGRRQLEVAQVEEAWADLQQLPAPCNEETQDEGGGVIEFGGLDDSPAEDGQAADAKVSLPPLRISPESERSDEVVSEPSEQLECIQQMLGSVQVDFQPTGSIGPELELVFDDPFEEEFEKEEVVTDHGVPQAELPAALSGDTIAPAQDRAPQTTHLPAGLPARAASDRPEEPAPTADLVEAAVAGYEADRETLPLHRHEPAEEPDDEDLVIVEEDYDDAPLAACPIVAVRRQEYGRLFTKLRQG
jgi:hypothetical protein